MKINKEKRKNKERPKDEDDPLATEGRINGPLLWAVLIFVPVFLIMASVLFKSQHGPAQEEAGEVQLQQTQRPRLRDRPPHQTTRRTRSTNERPTNTDF